MGLTLDERTFRDENGYLAIDGILREDEVEALPSALDRLTARASALTESTDRFELEAFGDSGGGRRSAPIGWRSTLSVVRGNVPLIQHEPASLYPEAILRSALTGPESPVEDARSVLPTASGLVVEPDPDTMRRFAV